MFEKVKHLNEYKTFKNKSNIKTYWTRSKWIKYKIFKLNYGNAKLSNVWKYKKVRLMLSIFAPTCLY